MEVKYDGVTYKIYNEVANQYRLVGNEEQIWFECEWKDGGSYFKIKSVTRNNRTYVAQRYYTWYLPIVREAVFMIAKTDGLYDYEHDKVVYILRGYRYDI